MDIIVKEQSDLPKINVIPDKIHDLLLLNDLEFQKESPYTYNDIGIPRVSRILEECISKKYLTIWAAKIGLQSYFSEKRKATTIGTRVHEMIENYLLYGTDLDLSYKTAPSYMDMINNAYCNFKDWKQYIGSLGYYIEDIIATETTILCPYYGGTIDCICRINGKNYIVDFKTSKRISYEYIIQVCAYMWAVNNGYGESTIPHIDGVGIIRVDKEKKKFEDLFLNEFIAEQNYIIHQYYKGFASLLASYYNNLNMKYFFDQYTKQYETGEILNE